MGSDINFFKQNIIAASEYAKAENKTQKGTLKTDTDTNETLKSYDSNNDNKVSKNEVLNGLRNANGDDVFSSKDLNAYISFYNLSVTFRKNDNNTITDTDFDVDGDGKLDESEKMLKSAFDSDNNGIIDDDMLSVFDKDNNINQKLVKLIQDEIGVLNKKINPKQKDGLIRQNRVIDTETGRLLSQEIVSDTGNRTLCAYEYNSEDGSYKKTYTYQQTGNQKILTYNKDRKRIEKTIIKDGIKTVSKNNEDGSKKVSVYNSNGDLTSEKDTAKNGDTITRKYNEDGSYTEEIRNAKTKTTTITTFDSNKRKVTEETKDKSGNIKTSSYNENNQLIKEVTKKTNGDILTREYLEYDGDFPTKYTIEYNYTNGIHTYSEVEQTQTGLPDKPNYVESAKNYQYINGKKLLISELSTEYKDEAKLQQKFDELDEEKKALYSNFETYKLANASTNRVFYFYDENGNKIKEEHAKADNYISSTGKSIKTNDLSLKDKKVITFNPDTGKKESAYTFYKSTNGTTDKSDDEVHVVKWQYDENENIIKKSKDDKLLKDYQDMEHNVNNVSREEFIAEAEKYQGFNQDDGSYLIFGTNGSPCATFTTFIMNQLGFDLTTLPKRSTPGIRDLAINDNRAVTAETALTALKSIEDNFKQQNAEDYEKAQTDENLKKQLDEELSKLLNEKLNTIIKPGDVLTITTNKESDNSYIGSHTTIVKEVSYSPEKGIRLTLTDTSTEEENGKTNIKNISYNIYLDDNGNVKKSGTKNRIYNMTFCDFISSSEEIDEKNEAIKTMLE